MEKEPRAWKIGQRKYDAFLAQIGYTEVVMMPHTSTLETLAGLLPKSNTFIRVAVVELAKNF